MTAINLFVGPNAATLLTDRGSYAADGTLLHLGSKVFQSPTLPLAIVAAGEACGWYEEGKRHDPVRRLLRELLDRAMSIGEVLQGIPAALEEAIHELERAGAAGGYVQLCVAAWDGGPQGFVIGTPGHQFPGLPAYTLAGASGTASPPVDRSFWPEDALDAASARRLIDEQRRTPDEDGICRVGGGADLATVVADGVKVEPVRRWPEDRIGRKLKPRRWRLLSIAG